MDEVRQELDHASGRANRARRDLAEELISDLEQIEDNAALFRRGRNSAYQAVAGQLRNLLLKGPRGLMQKVLPDATFHEFRRSRVELPPRGEQSDPAKHDIMIFDARGRLRLRPGGGSHIELEFEREAELLQIEKWLDQWIIRPEVTVRKLIQDVANEEVGHTQERIGPVIQHAEGFVVTEGRHERRVPAMAIVALGEYVTARVRKLLNEKDSTSIRND